MVTKHLKNVLLLLVGIILLTSCDNINSFIYQQAYNNDVKTIRKEDKKITQSSHKKEKKQGEKLYYKRMDYAEFRRKFYTDKDFRESVEEAIREKNKYIYSGRYQKLEIKQIPPKHKERAIWND